MCTQWPHATNNREIAMDNRYATTQKQIKERIRCYVEQSDSTEKELSEVLGRAPGYLKGMMTRPKPVGMISLKHVATLIPMPQILIDKAQLEHDDRASKRGKRIKVAKTHVPWTQSVKKFIKNKPITHQPWGVSS